LYSIGDFVMLSQLIEASGCAGCVALSLTLSSAMPATAVRVTQIKAKADPIR
jgi:hypothetical protein